MHVNHCDSLWVHARHVQKALKPPLNDQAVVGMIASFGFMPYPPTISRLFRKAKRLSYCVSWTPQKAVREILEVHDLVKYIFDVTCTF